MTLGVDSCEGCWDAVTIGDGMAILGITIDCKETYSGLIGSVGNLLLPSKIRSISANKSSINLSASVCADQGCTVVAVDKTLLTLSLVLMF